MRRDPIHPSDENKQPVNYKAIKQLDALRVCLVRLSKLRIFVISVQAGGEYPIVSVAHCRNNDRLKAELVGRSFDADRYVAIVQGCRVVWEIRHG